MIPAQRERVRIRGRVGVYFVLGVELEGGFAVLLNLTNVMQIVDVPFARIEPFRVEPESDFPSM